jgi:hypothetical protein
MDAILNQILVYSPNLTNRLNYIFNIIFSKVLGLQFKITNDKNLFEATNCPKFTYSNKNFFPRHAFLSSHYLLFETDIHKVDIDIFVFQGNKAFFRTNENSFFAFDIFAASFYLISRYEEYLPFSADKFGRFDAKESLAYQESFLELPLINIWTSIFCKELCQIFPDLKPRKTEFKYISTIDIDNAWAHLNKGFLRTSLSLAKLLVTINFKGIIEKIKVLAKLKTDPYSNYNFLDEIHKKYGIEPICFILYSKYAHFDKNPSQKNKSFRKLIKDISVNNKIGLHPSFQSNKCYKILENEKKLLEKLVEKPIFHSRQHYLYMKMPETYENLLKSGIFHDYSMGYSSHMGFRASFCLPYNFFNLKKNEETKLEIVPFALMDVCFKDYKKINPEIALIQMKNIISSIKKVNGLFVSLWHNETLTESINPDNWRSVFEQMLKELKDGNKTY